jgi:hypothetical protein
MHAAFLQNLWPGLAVWCALYLSDYSLTLVGARLYRNGAGEKIVIEGSYELNPYFQRDIDTMRRVSPRFVWAMFLTVAVLSVVWRLAMQSVPEAYSFLLGFFILIQLAVHSRHLRSVANFRAALTDAVRGRIEYSRKTLLQQSSLDILSFAGLYLVLFVFTRSWFVLGGVISCAIVASQQWKLSRQHTPAPATDAVEVVPSHSD